MIQDFATVILGEDPRNIEKIWDKIYRKTFWGLGGGTIISAGMSAIDIALWDIKGKAWASLSTSSWAGRRTGSCALTQARSSLAGGRPDVPGEKSLMITPEDYANAAKKAMAEGYTAVKVDPLAFKRPRTRRARPLEDHRASG